MILFWILLSVISPFAYSQKKSTSTDEISFNQRPITLKGVIEEGLRKNPDERVRQFSKQLTDLDWEDTQQSFWFPNIELSLETDKARVYRLATMDDRGENKSTGITPEGTLTLDLGEYTVFNWGRDWLQYQIDEDQYKRTTETYSEERRDLKLTLVQQFFKLHLAQRLVNIYEEQLRNATFIYRFLREKAQLSKVSKQEYYAARNEYLRSQYELQEYKYNLTTQQEAMSELLGDSPSTQYALSENLRFKKLRYSMKEAIEMANMNNDEIEQYASDLNIAQKSYELTKKNNLPLPKFTVNLGAYKDTFDRAQNRLSFETYDGGSNIDLVASISATWNIVGEGGLFNARKTKKAFVEKELAAYKYFNHKRNVELEVRSLYQNLRYLENQFEVSSEGLKNIQKAHSTTMDNYIKGKAEFDEYKDTLIDLRQREVQMETSKYNHLSLKVSLARLLGIEEFPGHDFENLAVTGE